MSFDFPSSPTIGQQYSPVPGTTYTWNGVGWIAAATPPPGAVQIRRVDVTSAVASVDFTSGIDDTYDEYELHVINYQHSANDVNVCLRISTDGGATWKAGASDYQYAGRCVFPSGGGNSDIGNTTTGFLSLSLNVQSNVAGVAYNGRTIFSKPSSASVWKAFNTISSGHHSAAGLYWASHAGWYVAAMTPINGIRIFAQTGNITGGTFILYGIKASVAPAVATSGLVQIRRIDVAAAVAQVDFTSGIDGTYDEYELHWFNAMGSVDSVLCLRISEDGGATFKAGANDYLWGATSAHYLVGSSSFSGSAAGVSSIIISQAWQAANPTITVSSGVCRFFTPSSSVRKSFLYDSTTSIVNWKGYGSYITDTNPINAIRLFAAAGNITAGTFILYGVKK